MKIKIPFTGFYETTHGETELDYVEYAELYTDRLSEIIDIKLTFIKLISPKYYNFETDVIIADIEVDDLIELYAKNDIKQYIIDNFTSYDGFISFYSNDVHQWGMLRDWDCIQLGCLLDVYIDIEFSEDLEDLNIYGIE